VIVYPPETERIQHLRAHALDAIVPSIKSLEGSLLWFRGWHQASGSSSVQQRRTFARVFQIEYSTPVIDDRELIVGKPCHRQLSKTEEQELLLLKEEYEASGFQVGGQGSHMAVDYELLLKSGVSGVREHVVQLLRHCGSEADSAEFYENCIKELDAVIAYSQRYSRYASELAENCSDSQRCRELEQIAENCAKVPAEPAGCFREALQSIHFLTMCLDGLYQIGRPDRYLIELYRQDISSGPLSEEEAQELIDCLCLLFNEYVPKGLAVGFMVGGKDSSGIDVSNELTRMFLHSIGHTRMIYPGIGLCWTDSTPDDVMEKSCELLAEGHSHPALFNDRIITEGMMHYGLPASEACEYVHSTCVEITPIACSAVWVASPYINLPAILLEVLNGAGASGREPNTYEELKRLYRACLSAKIAEEAQIQNTIQRDRSLHGGDPLVSCFVSDCLDRGLDVDRGGARYNWIMPSFVGMANLIDSFVVLDQGVFTEGHYTLSELRGYLGSDFESTADIREELLSRYPKYGNNDPEVDSLATEIGGWIIEAVGSHDTFRGDRFIPSLFCWIQHERLGAQTGATPDGRSAGFPLGDGSGPAQGREHNGPTASILSATSWDHRPFIGGIAVNLKFSRKLFTGESASRLAALVRVFMARGGFEVQVNVVDRETLLEARSHPELYKDLVVRIGGYSDFFVGLTPAMQDEVILRSEHQV
jgi:trans-4-hydroxy-L-proline dehydratase